MRKSLQLIGLILFHFLTNGPAAASTIKKKSGEVIEGAISGNLLLKGKVEEEKVGEKIRYTISYFLISGKDIDSIDGDGVHGAGDVIFFAFVAVADEKMPDEKGVIENALKIGKLGNLNVQSFGDGGMLLAVTPIRPSTDLEKEEVKKDREANLRIASDFYGDKGRTAVSKVLSLEREYSARFKETSRRKGRPSLTWTDKLLGEFRLIDNKHRVIPALVVAGDKGDAVILVNEL